MTRQEFEADLLTLKPDQTIIYHTGNMIYDRLQGPHCMAVDNIARAAWTAMEAGKVRLAQKRVGRAVAYCAIGCAKPYVPVEWIGCYAKYGLYAKPPMKLQIREAA